MFRDWNLLPDPIECVNCSNNVLIDGKEKETLSIDMVEGVADLQKKNIHDYIYFRNTANLSRIYTINISKMDKCKLVVYNIIVIS